MVAGVVAVMLVAVLVLRLPVSGRADSPLALRRQMRTIVDMQRAEAGVAADE